MACPAAGIDNLLLVNDSFKTTHYLQYPPNTTTVYSYFESRGGKFPTTVFFGLQYIIKRWLCGQVVTEQKIQDAKEFYDKHFLHKSFFNVKGWTYILEKYNGHLPLRIKAVPEGTVVPYKNVLFTIENTDPNCYWLTNYLETLFSHVWYPMTVATSSRYQKEIIIKYLLKTTDKCDNDSVSFMLHDFGFRGSTSVESAGIGGCAHLINFKGSDTIAGITTAQMFYNCDMAGFAIVGNEHSTVVSWDSEKEAFDNYLTTFPDGPLACVVDSYNIWDTCEKVLGGELKHRITNRGQSGPVLVRPDSGDPVEVVGKVLDILGERFGKTKNSKGYNVLPPYVRVLQGDEVSYETLGAILDHMEKNGWSAENISFGSGGALLQQVERNTQKCGFKCSYIVRDGKGKNVFKQPITYSGKNSKKGKLTLEHTVDGGYITRQEGTGDPDKDLLVTVFENGVLLKDYSLDEIRQRAEINPDNVKLN